MTKEQKIIRAAVGQQPQQRNVVRVVEGQHPIVEQIGSSDRGLAIVELGEAV